MVLSAQQKEKNEAHNQQEYGERYGQIRFPESQELAEAEAYQSGLLKELDGSAVIGCLGTKLDMAGLSPGCRLCVAGQWSCLFINGKCNGRCFYCPTSQNDVAQPQTNTVSFTEPRDYVAYLERFGFTGASISGGEPLITLDRSLRFVRAIKKHFGANMHVWLYTNGILADQDTILRLRDAGLDEIRFDIGATGYSLSQLRLAVGHIPTVTVEIPAVPEEGDRLKSLLPILHDSGVQHLNLHQLRLTPYNFERLVSRGYRFLHGEKVTVLDSELTALELILHGKQNNIGLPINYCSFPYKNRFQGRAARRRNCGFVMKTYETATPNGFIRTVTLSGQQEHILQCCAAIEQPGPDGAPADRSLWKLSSGQDKLQLHPDLLARLDASALNNVVMTISYCAAYQRQNASYRNPFTNVELTRKKKLVVERESSPISFTLTQAQMHQFAALPTAPDDGDDLYMEWERCLESFPAEMRDLELTRPGLAVYY